jgi:hypothetical protein
MDPIQIVEATGAYVGLKDLLPKVLGPTAEYLGDGLKNLTETGVSNLVRVFSHAEELIRERNDPAESVPPRVLKGILNEGYFCDDELEAAYLGGVLASAKGPVSRDDRAMSYLSVLSSLSSYQIRTHCIIYTSLLLNKEMPARQMSIHWSFQKTGLTVCLSDAEYKKAMEFASNEDPDLIAQHSFVGLEKHGLSKGGIQIVKIGRGNSEPFRYFYPTIFGLEVFVWGLGYGKTGAQAFFTEGLLKSPLPNPIFPMMVELGEMSY